MGPGFDDQGIGVAPARQLRQRLVHLLPAAASGTDLSNFTCNGLVGIAESDAGWSPKLSVAITEVLQSHAGPQPLERFQQLRSRRRHRLCENSDRRRATKNPTSPFDIWRVFICGEGFDDHFFEVPKRVFGVFTQSGQFAPYDLILMQFAPTNVGGYAIPENALTYG